VNLRLLAAAVLALPVLVAVYLRAATRSRSAIGVSLVAGAGIVIGAMLVSASQPSPSAAMPARPAIPTLEAFRPIVAGSGSATDGRSSQTTAALRQAAIVTSPTGPSDRTGETALAASEPRPSVVRFRPRNGSRAVEAPLEVSVRFTQRMDRATTTPAFSVVVDGTAWTGKARWAETDTVLVIRLARRLPAGARVQLVVSETARSAAGKAIVASAEAAFTIATPPPAPVATQRPIVVPPSVAPPRAPASGWAWPLLGRVTQRFGQSLTKYGYHEGLDIDGDTGDSVRAARAGRVTLAGKGDSCGGIQVHLDHGGGIETWYRHLSALSVKVGQQVERGQVVGRVGDTGCSLGSHLHFGVRRSGTFVDPLLYLPPR